MAAITLGVIAVAAAGASAYNSHKASKAQRKALAAQQKQADIENARSRRATIRNARVARASVENQAAQSGLGGSSMQAGSISNIQSRMGENLSFLDQSIQTAQQASTANIQAAGYQQRANNWQTVSSMASMGSSVYAGAKPQGEA